MKNARLSIISINYNNLMGLQRTVESVINQTWKEFEYIVIDGGSTDGSVEYIKEQSDKLSYWVSEPDTGIYDAMNKGIRNANGKYLLFLNSGDELFDNKILENNIQYLQTFDFIYFSVNIISNARNWIQSPPSNLSLIWFFQNTINHQSIFTKKDVFKFGMYDENYKIVSDWKQIMLGIFKYNCSYKKINVVLAKYYLDGFSSDEKNFQLLLNERKEILKEEFSLIYDEFIELIESRSILDNLRKSRKLKLLKKLNIINEF